MSVFSKRSAAIDRAARQIGDATPHGCRMCGRAIGPTHRLKETRRGIVHAACAEMKASPLMSLAEAKRAMVRPRAPRAIYGSARVPASARTRRWLDDPTSGAKFRIVRGVYHAIAHTSDPTSKGGYAWEVIVGGSLLAQGVAETPHEAKAWALRRAEEAADQWDHEHPSR